MSIGASIRLCRYLYRGKDACSGRWSTVAAVSNLVHLQRWSIRSDQGLDILQVNPINPSVLTTRNSPKAVWIAVALLSRHRAAGRLA